MTAEERLQELLDKKDEELEALREKVAKFEEPQEWRWMMHTDRKTDTHTHLPVPRLELRCEPIYEGTWSAQLWTYCLVYKHLLGHLVWVPLGETKRTGAGMDAPGPALTDLPFRDGAHIKCDSITLGLPAYVVIGERAQLIAPMDEEMQRRLDIRPKVN